MGCAWTGPLVEREQHLLVCEGEQQRTSSQDSPGDREEKGRIGITKIDLGSFGVNRLKNIAHKMGIAVARVKSCIEKQDLVELM